MSFKVLLYHEVRDSILEGLRVEVASGYDDVLPKPLYVRTEDFKKQMMILKQKNYYFMNVQDLRDYYEGNLDLPEKTVLITFDDGFQSQYNVAYPILKSLGIPAIMFTVGGWLFDVDKYAPKNISRTMSVKQMMSMGDVFERCHHTYNIHNRQTFLMNTYDTFKEDMAKNQRYCDHMDVFAYPFGLFDEAMEKTVHEVGIKFAFTSIPGTNDRNTNPLRLHRCVVAHEMTLEQFMNMLRASN